MNAGLSANDCATYAVLFAQAGAAHAREPEWLRSLRQTAFDAFVTQGWPSRKQEEWRFTDPGELTSACVPPARDAAAASAPIFAERLRDLGRGRGHRLVLLDSQPTVLPASAAAPSPGLLVCPLRDYLASESPPASASLGSQLGDRDAFVALNTAFMTNGGCVRIPAGLVVEAPIFLIFLAAAEGSASFPRTVVTAGAHSQATVVEIHVGADGRATYTDAVTEIEIEPGAQLAYHLVEQASPTGTHLSHLAVRQQAGSVFRAHSLALAGRLVRNDVRVVLAEPNCACQLDGLYLAGSGSHIDNQTSIDHRAPRCESRESYRGVVAERGQAVWSGRAVVRPGAQGTDARQSNRNLILADGAIVHAKPHLEIFASDVKCSHGATVGRLDGEALFYLRSRGIGEREAHQMLIAAFLREGLGAVAHGPLRGELEAILASRAQALTHAGAVA